MYQSIDCQLSELRRSDHEELFAMLGRCSDKTLYARFMTLAADAPKNHVSLLYNDVESITLVGRIGALIVGIGSIFQCSPDTVELDLLVEDDFQGCGIGRLLMAGLCQRAAALGRTRIEMTMLTSNTRMFRLVRSFDVDTHFTHPEAGILGCTVGVGNLGELPAPRDDEPAVGRRPQQASGVVQQRRPTERPGAAGMCQPSQAAGGNAAPDGAHGQVTAVAASADRPLLPGQRHR